MSFNILADRRTWNSRRSGIVDIILDLDADVVGLQEALDTQRAYLETALASQYELIEFNISGNYDNPILLRNNRFTLLDQGTDLGSVCQGFDRYITWLLLNDNETDDEFYFYNNHYCITPNVNKETHAINQAQLIDLHQSGTANRSAISVGDFNARRNSNIMRYLLNQVPIDGISNPVDLDDTWDIANPNTPKPPTTERGASIDWILTLEGTNVTDAFVGDADGYSDHNPLTATFDL
ncbi:endonuclease/exonuclease/phosphatase family protein [Chengkuizengella axinellae]|uniref:Endonuclease/exonuclease/phosphatase family protein n=1 Tax=Chengkuizengella axinellae TaxID=3064388 RepID=A0ABT9J207_9BACL|nr:endonuclease/exonuclease/phosphatase family protein [Chengkuizengella sp. 2205SS18-9]MDP5275462.1 endonuclease/exonuclease/phosphatase family protein [Chengkuizengella sp. 2205SS18-9]